MAEGRGLGGSGGGRGLGSGSSSGRGINRKPTKKKDDGFSILRAALTPAEWLINTVSRPAYSVGSLVAGRPQDAVREMLALGTLGISEKVPGLDAPEVTVSQALQGRGVNFGPGVPGFILRFGTDVVTDPTSYVTFGTSGAVRQAGRAAVKTAGDKAAREAAELGYRGRNRQAFIQSSKDLARTEVRRSMPRQFAVNFAPLGVTYARRGKAVASKDVVLNASKLGRQIERVIDASTRSRAGKKTADIFATGGDPNVVNRAVDAAAQGVRRVMEQAKRQATSGRAIRGAVSPLARQAGRARVKAKANNLRVKDVEDSLGLYQMAKVTARAEGTSVKSAYDDLARIWSDESRWVDFDTLERVFKSELRYLPAVGRRTAAEEIRAGVRAADSLVDDYVQMTPRRARDIKKVEQIEGVPRGANALTPTTSLRQRTLKTPREWAEAGLVPEFNRLVIARKRINESIDLQGKQMFINVASSRFGRVVDEAALLARLGDREMRASQARTRSANVLGRARDTQAQREAAVASRADDARTTAQRVADEVTGQDRLVGEMRRVRDVERVMQERFPTGTVSAARAAVIEGAGGPVGFGARGAATVREVRAIASADEMVEVAKRELTRRKADVDAGLDRTSVLGPYERLLSRAERAAANARSGSASRIKADLARLKDEAANIVRAERSARRAALKKANADLRAARKSGNKSRIEKAKTNRTEATLRLRIAEGKAATSARRVQQQEKVLARRAESLDVARTAREAGEQQAARTRLTPGERVSPAVAGNLRNPRRMVQKDGTIKTDMTPDEALAFRDGAWQEVKLAHDSAAVLVPAHVREVMVEAMNRTWRVTNNQSVFADARRFVESATGRWKGLALISIGYHMRNLQSDLMMAWMAGAKDPRSIVTAVQMLRGRKGSMVLDGKRMTYDDVLAEARATGTIDVGEIAADAGRVAEQSTRRGGVVGAPRPPGEGALAQGSYRVGRFREDATRLMLYVERRKAGDTAEEAADVVRAFMFDYGHTSKFVDSSRRFMLPFITWSAKALPRVLKQAVEKPRTLTRIGFLTDAANESFGPIDTGTLPIGRTLSFAVPTFGLGSGTYTYNPESVLPYGVLNSFNPMGFRQTGRSAGLFLNPAVRAPIELATNYNFYQGRIAPRRVQAPVWIRALSRAGVSGTPLDIGPKQDLYTKEEVPGYSRAFDTIFRTFPPYSLAQNYPGVGVESDRIGYLRSILGVNVSPYERQRDLFYAQRFAPRS